MTDEKENPAEEKAEVEGVPQQKEEEKEKAKEKKIERKGKRIRTGRKHEKTQAYKFYKVEGNMVKRVKKHCPRCGPGTWLAEHKGRRYCGRCGYTIFEKKTE